MKSILFGFLLLSTLGYTKNISANVIGVKISGESGTYRFSVTLESTETGCAQYADWWEVLSEDGKLLYRRILVHSHPDTQPFTRSGGNVKVGKDDVVYVRGHMNKAGYVGDVMKGSVSQGFMKVIDVPIFASAIEMQSPLPKGCLY